MASSLPAKLVGRTPDYAELFEMLRTGELWPEDAEPDGWRVGDRGEPADL